MGSTMDGIMVDIMGNITGSIMGSMGKSNLLKLLRFLFEFT